MFIFITSEVEIHGAAPDIPGTQDHSYTVQETSFPCQMIIIHIISKKLVNFLVYKKGKPLLVNCSHIYDCAQDGHLLCKMGILKQKCSFNDP